MSEIKKSENKLAVIIAIIVGCLLAAPMFIAVNSGIQDVKADLNQVKSEVASVRSERNEALQELKALKAATMPSGSANVEAKQPKNDAKTSTSASSAAKAPSAKRAIVALSVAPSRPTETNPYAADIDCSFSNPEMMLPAGAKRCNEKRHERERKREEWDQQHGIVH